MNQRVGLHLRTNTTFIEVIEQAIRLRLPFFQCFLVSQITGKPLKPNRQDISTFITLRRKHFQNLYIHGAYWINIASAVHTYAEQILEFELQLAQKLEFTHYILHSGAATGFDDKIAGIDQLARILNKIIKKYSISIVLENTAHGKLSIGSDITDFAILRTKLDQPESVLYCVDTAHAYAYGYNIANETEQDSFVSLLQKCIGIERIALLHINDTKEQLGSKKDHHAILGEGSLGLPPLQRFMWHPQLRHIPVMLELPELEVEHIEQLLRLEIFYNTEGSKL